MRWPWTKREDEERLKQELRRRAQAASGAGMPTGPVVEPSTEQLSQASRQLLEGHRAVPAAALRAPHPAPGLAPHPAPRAAPRLAQPLPGAFSHGGNHAVYAGSIPVAKLAQTRGQLIKQW